MRTNESFQELRLNRCICKLFVLTVVKCRTSSLEFIVCVSGGKFLK